jgi:hypothetical protein
VQRSNAAVQLSSSLLDRSSLLAFCAVRRIKRSHNNAATNSDREGGLRGNGADGGGCLSDSDFAVDGRSGSGSGSGGRSTSNPTRGRFVAVVVAVAVAQLPRSVRGRFCPAPATPIRRIERRLNLWSVTAE